MEISSAGREGTLWDPMHKRQPGPDSLLQGEPVKHPGEAGEPYGLSKARYVGKCLTISMLFGHTRETVGNDMKSNINESPF